MSDAINKLMAQNVVDKTSGELLDGVQIIPVGKLIDLAQYFLEDLIPRIEKRMGKDSKDYDNMLTAVNAMLYCIMLLDKWEGCEKKLQQTKLYAAQMRDLNVRLESELEKYTAIENAMTSGTIEMYQQVMRKKGIDLIQDAVRQYSKTKK